jgi:putative ATP-dependent endonuclease of OLD family
VVGQRVQAVVTSHSPAIVGRLEPTALRHVQRNRQTGVSAATPLKLPEDDDEAAKFVREAVRAHPELYFARHVIFGEGASEEIVVPRIAEALGVPMDRSFLAIVPIGGRHIDHFWRLVAQLGIPHTTLLDLDLGRSSGDVAQFKAIATAMLAHRPPTDATVKKNLEAALGNSRANGWGEKGWTDQLVTSWLGFYEEHGVFLSAPLDLDMLMLSAYPNAYMILPPGKKGPRTSENDVSKRTLGADGFGVTAYAGKSEKALFPWYSYLFLGDRGKPAVHLAALARLDDAALEKSCPPLLRRLIERVQGQLDAPPT